jgi:hypothetical protein
MPVRIVVALVLAAAALLFLAPAADAAPAVTARIGGVEYAATSTQGRFGGAADGQVRGAWQATVVHDPLGSGKAVPITDGSFTLRSTHREVRGRFVSGTVTPRPTPSSCGNERFDVRGTLALPGGRGQFTAVLTHLRVPSRSGCRTYGAVVVGALALPS